MDVRGDEALRANREARRLRGADAAAVGHSTCPNQQYPCEGGRSGDDTPKQSLKHYSTPQWPVGNRYSAITPLFGVSYTRKPSKFDKMWPTSARFELIWALNPNWPKMGQSMAKDAKVWPTGVRKLLRKCCKDKFTSGVGAILECQPEGQ